MPTLWTFEVNKSAILEQVKVAVGLSLYVFKFLRNKNCVNKSSSRNCTLYIKVSQQN